jgi:hypothetical protein
LAVSGQQRGAFPPDGKCIDGEAVTMMTLLCLPAALGQARRLTLGETGLTTGWSPINKVRLFPMPVPWDGSNISRFVSRFQEQRLFPDQPKEKALITPRVIRAYISTGNRT